MNLNAICIGINSLSGNETARYRSLALDFTSTLQDFDPRITYSRASNATYFDSTGTLQTAGSGVARAHAFQDHDPSTLTPLGFLIEEARTNLALYSAEFDNAAWTKSDASISANAVTAPDGTVSADKIVEAATTAAHFTRQNVTGVVATTYADSVFLKAAERTTAVFIIYDGAAFNGASINLNTGAVSAPPADLGIVDYSASIATTQLPNGWYRVSGAKAQVSTTTHQIRVTIQNGANGVYAGDGTSGLYIWGAQIEAGAFATSPILTAGSAATRLADSASITGTNFSSWYNQTEGTFVVSADINALSSAIPTAWRIDDTTDDERVFVRNNGSGVLTCIGIDGGATQWALQTGNTLTAATRFRHALAYKANDIATAFNGANVLTDGAATLPTVTRLLLGAANTTGGDSLNGHIQRLTYYRTRLPNTTQQALTS